MSQRGRLDDKGAQHVFTKKGKMIRYARGDRPEAPENTTINAVIVAGHYPVGQKLFLRHIRALEQERGSRSIPADEFHDEAEQAEGTERDLGRRVVRVVVHENPYARIPLDRALFTGPFDERYGADDQGRITRVFAGAEVAAFEGPAL